MRLLHKSVSVSLRTLLYLYGCRDDRFRGKTFCVNQSLLQQASDVINPPPERIVWCYSQWQPAYMQMLVTIPKIDFAKGIPPALEHDSYFDVNTNGT